MESSIHVFLSYLRVEKGLAQNTILAYGRDLKRFAEFLRKRHKQRMEDVTREDVVDFLSSLYKEKLDSRSVARYLVSLRGLYKFGMMEGTVNTDPTENLESPKVRSSLPTYLRVEEIDKLLQAPNLATPFGLTTIFAEQTRPWIRLRRSTSETTKIKSAPRWLSRSKRLKSQCCLIGSHCLLTHTSEPLNSSINGSPVTIERATPVQLNRL